jgi:RNA polymerase sigma-70 factor (ECF subfamily)
MTKLQAAVRDAVQVYPELGALASAFTAHLEERDSTSFEAQGPEIAAERLLTWACAQQDPRALDLLHRHHLSRLDELLGGCKLPPEELDEVRQRLCQRLLVAGADGRMRIGDFDGRSPLQTWLRVVAVRLASNLRRDRLAIEARERRSPIPAAAYIDPELDLVRRRFGADFQNAFREAFQTLSPEERSTFRLHYVDGLALEDIGAMLKLSRATVGRRLLEGRRRLVAATLESLETRLDLGSEELASLLNAVRSGLELSLGGLLRDVAVAG